MSVYVAKHRAPDIDDEDDDRDYPAEYLNGDIPETDDEMYEIIDNVTDDDFLA